MKRKIILSLVCMLFVLTLLTGCATSKEEKEKRNKYFKQAKENAISYIEQKYGFTPTIKNAKCTFDNSDNFSSNCNETIRVIAEYNNRNFEILIDGSTTSGIGADNYQYEDIANDLIKILSSDYNTPNNYKFYYGYDDLGIINAYYNGTNLEEIFNNKDLKSDEYLQAFIGYINKDNFENLQNKLNNSKYNIFSKLYIINYNSSKSYKKMKDNNLCILCSTGGGYFEDYFNENKEYLKDVTVLYHGDVKFYDFSK